MGLFTPAWMSDNYNRAVRAAERTNTDKKLAEIAKKSPIYAARKVAVEKLIIQSVLIDIARTDDDSSVRKSAVNKLINQPVLAEIARTDSAGIVRLAAVEKLTDQSVLAEIAENDEEHQVREAAQKKLPKPSRTNQSICAEFLDKTKGFIDSREVYLIECLADELQSMSESTLKENGISIKTHMITEFEHAYTTAKTNRLVTEFFNNGKLVFSRKTQI